MEAILNRLRSRAAFLAASAALTAIFAGFGGLSLAFAAAGFGALVLWAALWPDASNLDGGNSAEAWIRNSAQRTALWRAMLDGIPDPAFALDADRTVIAANKAVEGLMPVRTGQHMAQTSRAPELLGAIDAALAGRGAQAFSIHARVPVERTISGWVTPLPEPQSAVDPALLIVARDLTEQDRLAQMRADFVANASHELRTPLAVLKGFVETLQLSAKDDPDARERFLAIMSEQAERMTRLIDDLLSLSRIEMRAHLPPRGVVDLNEVTARVVKGLEPLAKAADVALKWEPLPQSAEVRGDNDEIVQAVQNLVQNAIKYGRRGGKVDVKLQAVLDRGPRSAEGRTRWFALAIADDGPGIPREHLPRLTERFYRVSVGASRDKGGTGLGLAIVKHIVARHEGELQIESQVGRGSIFTIRLKERGNEVVPALGPK